MTRPGTMFLVVPTDVELVAQARRGSASALGTLLERHRAGVTAAAVRILGHRPDIDDVVHDTFLVALTHIDKLRDPEAAGSWLMGIARNVSLQRLRADREVPDATVEPDSTNDPTEPEQAIDQLALREWVWSAIEGLSEPLRLPVILRHFTGAMSSGYRDHLWRTGRYRAQPAQPGAGQARPSAARRRSGHR